MKKVLFLMFLLFLGLGTASVKAQVRIGGNTAPNASAVLDLNATDAATGTKGLALPRVNLASNTAQITTGVANLTGMLVYNTNATLGVGIYFWDGSNWIIISGDGIVGNELTDTIAGGGLNKTGAGTAASPYKVGIKTGGVVTGMIVDKAVTLPKIATVQADSGHLLMSTGTGLVFTGLFNAQAIVSDSILTSRPLRPVSWSVVVDTTINIQKVPNRWMVAYVRGVAIGDVCMPSQMSDLWYIGPGGNNLIFAISLHVTRNTSGILSFRCFRPSY